MNNKQLPLTLLYVNDDNNDDDEKEYFIKFNNKNINLDNKNEIEYNNINNITKWILDIHNEKNIIKTYIKNIEDYKYLGGTSNNFKLFNQININCYFKILESNNNNIVLIPYNIKNDTLDLKSFDLQKGKIINENIIIFDYYLSAHNKINKVDLFYYDDQSNRQKWTIINDNNGKINIKLKGGRSDILKYLGYDENNNLKLYNKVYNNCIFNNDLSLPYTNNNDIKKKNKYITHSNITHSQIIKIPINSQINDKNCDKNCDKIGDKNCDKNHDNIKIKNQYIHNLKLIQQSISLNNLYILLYGQSNSININLYNELILNFNEYNLYIHTYVNNRLLINDTQKLLEKHFNNKNIIIDIEDDIKNYLIGKKTLKNIHNKYIYYEFYKLLQILNLDNNDTSIILFININTSLNSLNNDNINILLKNYDIILSENIICGYYKNMNKLVNEIHLNLDMYNSLDIVDISKNIFNNIYRL